MGLSGSWALKQQQGYTGATKWGTGINPVHADRNNGRGKVIGTRENLLPLGEPSDVVSDTLTSREIDWVCEDYVDGPPGQGESYRYQDDRPRFNVTTPQFRDETNSAAMGETTAWGVYYDYDPDGDFPLPGPTGGTQLWLDVDHGERVERQHAIAVPTPGVSGGWLGKVRGAMAAAESQEPAQEGFVFTINNTPVQGPGVKMLDNSRAVARGTDDPRSSILSRTAAMVEKKYGQSFGMGGGPGTPDMLPQSQTVGLRRPFWTRTAAAPPLESHQFNTMEGRVPISRVLPPDPYQGDPETAGGIPVDSADDGGWGY